jgi:hypothetical protein
MPKIDRLSDPVAEAAKFSAKGIKGARSREFRDALTRVEQVLPGARTNVLHWEGSTGSK